MKQRKSNSIKPPDMTEDGFPANRTYSDQMFQWIEKTLAESDDFDFLFVAGHYQVIDPS